MKELQQTMINQALACYLSDPALATVSPLGNGHINQTLLVSHAQGKFVLQRINEHVFPQPQVVVNNALAIDKFLTQHAKQYPFVSMAPKQSLNGHFVENVDGQFWRAFSYISGCHSIESMGSCDQARQAAYAFSVFSGTLNDISANALTPVIENFHDLDSRMAQLTQAIAQNKAKRLVKAQSLVDGFLAQTEFINLVTEKTKHLPTRITHNDTKINNLLFDSATNQPHAVIDLDTCMPGYLMHDFGDMVRTCCSSLAEDATNLSQMTFKQDIFDALHQGYLQGAQGTITPLEIESLRLGGVLMPFIIGSRFLTDHLNGDCYFSVDHQLHNLQRAANQFAFYQLVKKQLVV